MLKWGDRLVRGLWVMRGAIPILRLEAWGAMRKWARDQGGEEAERRAGKRLMEAGRRRIRLAVVWRMRLSRKMGGRTIFIRMGVSFQSPSEEGLLTGTEYMLPNDEV